MNLKELFDLQVKVNEQLEAFLSDEKMLSSMSDVDFYKLLRGISSQRRAGFIERRAETLGGWKVIPRDDRKGDFVDLLARNQEFKHSYVSNTGQVNMVQVRPDESWDYVLFRVIMETNSPVDFMLSKNNVLQELKWNGWQSAHGKSPGKFKAGHEYAIRFKENSYTWHRFESDYMIDDSVEKFTVV